MSQKTCKICNVAKSTSNFDKARVGANGTVYYQSYCKICASNKRKQYYNNHQKKQRKFIFESNPELVRALKNAIRNGIPIKQIAIQFNLENKYPNLLCYVNKRLRPQIEREEEEDESDEEDQTEEDESDEE